MQAICFRLQSMQRSVSSLVSGIPRAKIRDSQIALRIFNDSTIHLVFGKDRGELFNRRVDCVCAFLKPCVADANLFYWPAVAVGSCRRG